MFRTSGLKNLQRLLQSDSQFVALSERVFSSTLSSSGRAPAISGRPVTLATTVSQRLYNSLVQDLKSRQLYGRGTFKNLEEVGFPVMYPCDSLLLPLHRVAADGRLSSIL